MEGVKRVPGPMGGQIRAYLDRAAEPLKSVSEDEFERFMEARWRAWEADSTVFLIGHGGSASTASHMACDLGKQTQLPGRRPLRTHSLTDSMALITALANDLDYSRPVDA